MLSVLWEWKGMVFYELLQKNEPWRKYRIEIHSESIRTIPNQSEKRFVSRLMKNGQKSIRLNPINSETSIRTNPNKSELGLIQTEFSIRINRNHFYLGFIQIDSD